MALDQDQHYIEVNIPDSGKLNLPDDHTTLFKLIIKLVKKIEVLFDVETTRWISHINNVESYLVNIFNSFTEIDSGIDTSNSKLTTINTGIVTADTNNSTKLDTVKSSIITADTNNTSKQESVRSSIVTQINTSTGELIDAHLSDYLSHNALIYTPIMQCRYEDTYTGTIPYYSNYSRISLTSGQLDNSAYSRLTYSSKEQIFYDMQTGCTLKKCIRNLFNKPRPLDPTAFNNIHANEIIIYGKGTTPRFDIYIGSVNELGEYVPPNPPPTIYYDATWNLSSGYNNITPALPSNVQYDLPFVSIADNSAPNTPIHIPIPFMGDGIISPVIYIALLVCEGTSHTHASGSQVEPDLHIIFNNKSV